MVTKRHFWVSAPASMWVSIKKSISGNPMVSPASSPEGDGSGDDDDDGDPLEQALVSSAIVPANTPLNLGIVDDALPTSFPGR
jgi:hypothetical protein